MAEQRTWQQVLRETWRTLLGVVSAGRTRNRRAPTGLVELVAEIRAVVTSAQATTARTLTWEINRAATEAKQAEWARVEQARGVELAQVWVAERDACVHCLGMAGQTVRVGGEFTPESFDPRGPMPVFGDVFDGPPRHPHCRCQLTAVVAGDDGGFAEALRREAERSVANGYSLPSEPESVRLAAAEALVNRPNRLPRTVVERAQRNIDRGQIKREFPG